MESRSLKLSSYVGLLHDTAEVQQDAISQHGALISVLSVDPEAPATDMVTGNRALQQISRLHAAKE